MQLEEAEEENTFAIVRSPWTTKLCTDKKKRTHTEDEQQQQQMSIEKDEFQFFALCPLFKLFCCRLQLIMKDRKKEKKVIEIIRE